MGKWMDSFPEQILEYSDMTGAFKVLGIWPRIKCQLSSCLPSETMSKSTVCQVVMKKINQSKAPREDGETAVVRRCQERPQSLSRDLKEVRE